ncbi:phage baseplate assembly protein V [Ornithinimicrobium sp. LYQ121]|uniref:phage baseplate assembly protein V n=1 Tax=Ornithinimicrobium sp. LYQ121 TaxID=3378801 RepID=UPI003854D99E
MISDDGAQERPDLDGLVIRARKELRGWTDQADIDPGVALVELLALVGDLLASHTQRLEGEGCLGSARRDASVGRRLELELEVEVEVDGASWQQVADLAGSAPEDHHYLVRRREDGASVIEFGDGVHGRRPPSGSPIRVRRRYAGTYSSVVVQQGRVVLDTDENEELPRASCGLYRATVLDNADPLARQRLLVRIPEVSGHPVWAAACLPVPGTTELPAIGVGVWIALELGDPSRPIWLGQRAVE